MRIGHGERHHAPGMEGLLDFRGGEHRITPRYIRDAIVNTVNHDADFALVGFRAHAAQEAALSFSCSPCGGGVGVDLPAGRIAAPALVVLPAVPATF